MGNKKQLAINMIAQIIGFSVNFAIGFFLTPFIVKNVGTEAYGFVGLANSFISFAQIITVALNSMAGRFITISLHKEKAEDVNKYFTSVFIANVIISIFLTVIAIITLVLLDSIVNVPDTILLDVTFLWGLLFLGFIMSIIGSVFNVATFSLNRLDLAALRDLSSNILKAVVLMVAYYSYTAHIWYIGLSSMICTIFIIVVNLLYTKKLLPSVKMRRKYFDFQKIKTLISSGIWNSFTHMSNILSNGLNLMIANLFINAAAMGILSVSKTIPTMILSVFGILASVFSPQLTISYAKGDLQDMTKQLISSIKFLGIFACIPVAILFAYGDIFYGLWVPTEDSELLQVLSILTAMSFIFALPLEGIWNVFTVTNKVKQVAIYMFINSIFTILVVLVALNFTKSDTMGLYIITATSTVSSIVLGLTFLPLYGAYCLKLKLSTFYPAIIRNTIAVSVITLISIGIKNLFIIDSWIMLIFAVLLTSISSFALNSILVLSKHERKVLIEMVTKRIRIKGGKLNESNS